MFDNISPSELRELVKQDENAVLIDVRSPEECDEGMIEGSVNINLFDPSFMNEIGKLDKSKNYYMICRSGNRSSTACGAMAQMGFGKLYNLSGGMMAWDGEVVFPK